MRTLIALSLLAFLFPSAAADRQTGDPERFTAFAISLGGATTRPGTAHFEITVDRWSDEDELDMLLDALEKGQQPLLRALRERKPVGSIRTSGSLAYDLRYAHQQIDADGRRRIFLATERPMNYWELVNRRPTLDYPITVVELMVDKQGEGEGTLAVATRLTASSDRKRLYVQNYDVQPVMLKGIKRRN